MFHLAPAQDDIASLVGRASERILRFLQRRKVITMVTAPGDGEVTVVGDKTMSENDPLLAELLATDTAGPARKPLRIVLDCDRPHPDRGPADALRPGPPVAQGLGMPKQGTWLAATLGILATMAGVCSFAGRAKGQPAAEVKPSLPDADLTPQAFHMPASAFVPAKSWYGYQLMLSDLASIAVMLTAGDALTGPVAAGLLLLAAPSVIHGMHGNDTMAVVSPVMRLLLGVIGAGIGASARNCSHDESKLLDFCGLESGLAGMLVGMLVAGFVDYSLALQVVQPTNASPPARSSQSRVSLSNAGVAQIANGAAVVVGGRF